MLIVTNRAFQHWQSWDLVYEWEDELVKTFKGSKLYKAKEFLIGGHLNIKSIANKTGVNINRFLLLGRDAFRFSMAPDLNNNIWNLKGISTDIIDFYPKREMLSAFYRNYSKVKNLYVSSREVYDFLLKNQPEREIKHLPLTISDKYRISNDTTFEKKYDLIMTGRPSPKLLEYLKKYEKTHPITYVYRGKIENNNFPYYTNKGEFVGYGNTRDQYLTLMKNSKIALYSTPGINDEKENITNGFHQVTPRFLEEIACGCHVISQYIDNSDTEYFELGNMSSKISNYIEFEQAVEEDLATDVDMKKYSDYLEKHYTSTYNKLMRI